MHMIYNYAYNYAYNTQQDLLTPVQNWIRSLNNKGFGGALLMDLSKAFDTLNLDL